MSARPPHELMLAASVRPITMSSQEIAVLTSKQHQHVKRDIEKMLVELGEDVSKFGRIYRDSMNRPQTEYLLDRELTDTLLTGYSAVLRRKVIARWRELEGAVAVPALPNFHDPAAAARAWADEVEAKRAAENKVQQLEHKVADQAPAVAGFDRIANAAGTSNLSSTAKVLQLQPGQFIAYLLEKKWIFQGKSKSENTWYIAFQDKLDAKYLSHKFGSYQNPYTSEWQTKEQVMVTRKGVAKLAEMLAADAVAERLAAEAGQHQQRLPLPGDDG